MKINIDELLKQKYKEIEYTEDIQLDFKNTRKNNSLYKVASIMLLVILATVTLTIYNPFKKMDNNEKNINENIIANNDKDIKLPKAEKEIIINSDVMSYDLIDVKYILAIKVNKILGYTNYSEKKEQYAFPITKFEAEVLKCFKGEIDGNINIYTQGGIISLADWEKTLNEQQREKQRIQ
ncbi:MAG: hypothetical protein IJZ36_01060 [Bacilli bacterium]|nr:hypothetical protein [Bacilli bacterium]